MICPNCHTEIHTNKIELSDQEIKIAGMNRWGAKNNKRFPGIVFGGVALTFGASRVASLYPKSPVAFILAMVVTVVVIAAYIIFINNPQRKAGEEFLKEYRS